MLQRRRKVRQLGGGRMERRGRGWSQRMQVINEDSQVISSGRAVKGSVAKYSSAR
jgi:hypothetical protein